MLSRFALSFHADELTCTFNVLRVVHKADEANAQAVSVVDRSQVVINLDARA